MGTYNIHVNPVSLQDQDLFCYYQFLDVPLLLVSLKDTDYCSFLFLSGLQRGSFDYMISD